MLEFNAPTVFVQEIKEMFSRHDVIQETGLQRIFGGMRGIGTYSFFVSCREKHGRGHVATAIMDGTT